MAQGPENERWLVVGQGLAGTVIALTLANRGVQVHVADAGLPWAASPVAAGAFNPVTGKRMQLTWLADELWPVLEAFYPQAEALLNARFFFALPNLRPLLTAEERAEATRMTQAGPLAGWMTLTDVLPWAPANQVVAPFGALLVPRAGYVEVPVLCQAARHWLAADGAFFEQKVVPADLQSSEAGIIWQGRAYAGVIWAEGAAGKANPLLTQLPLAPLKGEILLLAPQAPPTLAGAVLNRAAYLAPRPDGLLWAGSTYQHQYESEGPTEEGRASILQRVGKFYLPGLGVEKHLAGIRPSVRDRRPIVGWLPEHAHQYVFTGLGTKGVSLAPWLAGVLADHLLVGKPVPDVVAVRQV